MLRHSTECIERTINRLTVNPLTVISNQRQDTISTLFWLVSIIDASETLCKVLAKKSND